MKTPTTKSLVVANTIYWSFEIILDTTIKYATKGAGHGGPSIWKKHSFWEEDRQGVLSTRSLAKLNSVEAENNVHNLLPSMPFFIIMMQPINLTLLERTPSPGVKLFLWFHRGLWQWDRAAFSHFFTYDFHTRFLEKSHYPYRVLSFSFFTSLEHLYQFW